MPILTKVIQPEYNVQIMSLFNIISPNNVTYDVVYEFPV